MPLSSARVFDYSDDAAVARLLADEAKAASKSYSSQGLSALLPKRSTGAAPKPNTRFLKNLVRDADQHNAALRRKEDRERVERLRNGGMKQGQHSREEESRSEHERRGGSDRDAKRRRTDDGRHRASKDADDRHGHSSSGRTRKKSPSQSRSRSRSRSRDRHARDRSRRLRPGSNTEENGRNRHHRDSHTSHRKHKRRRSESRSTSPPENRKRRPHPTSVRNGRTHEDGESSSDPLEDIVGPMPADSGGKEPVRYRGRGAHKLATTTNIDKHFSSKYDPSLDVQPDAEADEQSDWDMALDALRDRQAWQRKHAERMRAAGFNDEEIRKWEDSGREKDIRDVQWSEKGQTRAWDLGKDAQGHDEDEEDEEDRTGRLTP